MDFRESVFRRRILLRPFVSEGKGGLGVQFLQDLPNDVADGQGRRHSALAKDFKRTFSFKTVDKVLHRRRFLARQMKRDVRRKMRQRTSPFLEEFGWLL